MTKIIKIAVEGKTTLPLESLEPFQGALKITGKEDYEKFRNNMLKFGFSFVIHVWQSQGKNYIIDGHQRLSLLKQMKETEGYEIPHLPVALVQADTYKEAKKKILAGTSQYGKMTPQSLLEFAKINEIPIDDIIGEYVFSDFEVPDLTKLLNIQPDANAVDPMIAAASAGSKAPSSSDKVKSLQLFFNSEEYTEFLDKIEALRDHYEKANLSDVLLELVRENYSSKIQSK